MNLHKMTLLLTLQLTLMAIACEESEPTMPGLEMTRCDQLFPSADTVIVTHTDFTKTNYPARIKVFQADTIDEGDIVMLGNSLTEQGGNWNVKLAKTIVKNRGIAGDNTDGVRARLNELLCRKPSMVFIMIGTNDLFISYSAEKVAQNIDSIGSTLAKELPDTRIVVQTIMPLGAGNIKKSKLLAINEQLKTFENTGYEILDTFRHMANESGDLPQEYTHDGVHLTVVGYDRWVQLLKSKLNE